jgi:hypothetical protein
MGVVEDGTSAADDRPSRRVIEQRIRNRVIEYLDLAASFEQQRQYERDVPFVNVPYEVINSWEDNFPKDPRIDANLLAVYSPSEVKAIRHFHAVWVAAADALPNDYPTLAEVRELPEWEQLRRAAASTGMIFAERGTMPEDREVGN